MLADGAVRLSGSRLRWVGQWSEAQPDADEQVIDLGDAILLPGLVNAHCHLDYTDLLGQLAPPRAFPDWIKSILAAKSSWSEADFVRSWLHGARQLLNHGTTTVANIEGDESSSKDSSMAPAFDTRKTRVRCDKRSGDVFAVNPTTYGTRMTYESPV